MIIHWHRRDLRGPDNRALARAADTDRVVPVFVFDPTILEHASPIRVACLRRALQSLRDWYRDRESELVIAHGEASGVLPELVDEYDADAVSWNADYSGLATERDQAVTAALEDEGITVRTVHDSVCHEPGSISPNQGEHYSVFSYFWKKWRDREKQSPFDAPTADDLATDSKSLSAVPTLEELGFDEPDAVVPTVTREAGLERLETFCAESIGAYDDERDYPARDGTSKLSVHFKWGTLGPREVYSATESALEEATADEREGIEAFQRQLAFREFYTHVLAYNPEIVTANFSGYENRIEWRNDPDELEAWKAGETGYPIVDAGMRQLLAEGWVHNRVRMLVAAFLTKDLLVDWREGYDWYRQHLADHETANDVGGWQWAASTGMDAQPYFRVFNPMKQGREYDPDATYIKHYIPELEGVSAETIHDWCVLSSEEREDAAPDYPEPLVDHSERRDQAIEAFERARSDGSSL
ncbi:cryptochrome/photolyase family protein [Natronolimnobius baerhuensis]|uniref:Deoxyribodipyrimidine photolyase n=1 Tax=Natronolimnobius baerhuensis TaxID=253108 RepID=A0A202EDS5_9EURY|nr:deoxyribodipyrimidine photo-lyase [Natronolimnobius baerhuensis]OVE86357.1 deoxyribodipyrimidine photolyase [Natronolimnobius baerhuensis]